MTEPEVENRKSGISQQWIVLAVLCLPLFLLSIDMSVLNLALPAISKDLGSSTSQLQWVSSSYILAFASFLLTMGAISDRYGRKRLLQIGLFLFAIGSLAAALSNSTIMLISFRGFLGVAGAMISPSTLSIVVDTFRNPKERAQAIGIWAAVFALGSAFGPIVGGYLLQYFDWGSVFLVNIPIVAISLILAYFYIRESRGENAPKPDIPGMFISIIGLFALVYGIIMTGEHGWGNSEVLAWVGTGILLLIVFVLVEKKTAQPMLPPGFFKNRSFTVASLAMVLTIFAMAGALFLISQYFQSVQGYSPLASAFRMMPLGLTLFVAAMLSSRIAARIGAKLTIVIGIFLIGASMFYLSQILEVDSPYGLFVIGIMLTAVGLGLSSPPATQYIVSSLPVSRAGLSSGINNATRQLGSVLGVALLGSLMNSTYRSEISKIPVLNSLSMVAADAVRSSIQAAHAIAGTFSPDISGPIANGANRAYVLGMTDAMFIGAFILWGTALFTLVLLQGKAQRYDE